MKINKPLPIQLFSLLLFSSLSAVGFASDTNADANNHSVALGKLLFDRTEVSIADFAQYAKATGVITKAEREGKGLVYENGWEQKPGWNWKTPFGVETD